MDWFEGCTVNDIIQQYDNAGITIPDAVCRDIVRGVLSALDYLHEDLNVRMARQWVGRETTRTDRQTDRVCMRVGCARRRDGQQRHGLV